LKRNRPIVLVVDDDQPTRELLSDFLESEGYNVESARCGRDGLARVEAGGVDAILLDLRLPDMDGEMLCRTVRNSDRLADVPIILMSAEPEPLQRRATQACGASDHLVKPFDLDDLLTAVNGVRPTP
jgi:CheY-like chemotaxis protein